MKKLSIILLVLSMIISSICFPVFAEETQYVIDTSNWKEFYSGGRTTSAPDTYNGYLTLYPGGDWVSYDISNVKAGTYAVSFAYSIQTDNSNKEWKYSGLDLIVDDVLKAKAYLEFAKSKQPELISTPVEDEYIYISDDAKELKLRNLGRGCISLGKINLAKISSDDKSANLKIYAQNVTIQYDSTTDALKKSGNSIAGVDFYDSDTTLRTAYTNTKTVQYAQKSRILDRYDWARYDISGMEIGTYNVYICYANKTDIPITIKTNDNEGFAVTLEKTSDILTSSDATFNLVKLNKLPVTEDTTYLYVESSVAKTAQVYIQYIVLEPVECDVETNIVAIRTSANEVDVSVKNISPKYKENSVVIAGFFKDVLKEIKIASVELDPFEEYEFTKSMSLNNLDMLKVFVWEDLKTIKPVSVVSSGVVVPEYTVQYLDEGFTRFSLNSSVFKSENPRVFDLEIKEDGEYAVFIGQDEKLSNKYTIAFEKDGEVIPFKCSNIDETCYNYVDYVRVGAEKAGESNSVALSKGNWKMYVTSKYDHNISYIDVRSTIIDVNKEKIAIYPSDYNYIERVGPAYNINSHLNSVDKARVPGCNYYGDYLNDELLKKFEYGRGILIRNGHSYDHNYKLDINEENTYKITIVGQLTPPKEELSEDNKTVSFKLKVDSEEGTEYAYDFVKEDVNYGKSPIIRCEKIVTLDKGVHTLCISSSNTGYLHQIIVEPYIPEKLTEDGAEFSLVRPEVERFMEDAKVEYVKDEYSDYTTTIATNYCMDGSINLSDRPLPVSLLWDELDGAKTYTLYISESENFGDVSEFAEICEPKYDIYNLYTGKTYYWKVVGDNGAESDVKSFTTKNTVRFIYAPNGGNIRDLGGWNGLNLGMAYRGGHLDGDDATAENGIADNYMNIYLNEAGKKVFLETLKIKTDLDLRGNLSSNKLNIAQIYAPIGAYTGAFSGTDAYATAIRAFSDINNYPIYFHCTGGADRTGTVAFIIEAIAGASEEDLAIDFELTGASYYGHRLRTREGFVSLVNTMKEYEGETLQEKAVNYAITTLGLTRQEVSNIQSLLGGNKVVFTDAKNFVIGKNIVKLNNLNDNIILKVRHNGEVLSADLNENGEISVEFLAAGDGEIIFGDGTSLKFKVE